MSFSATLLQKSKIRLAKHSAGVSRAQVSSLGLLLVFSLLLAACSLGGSSTPGGSNSSSVPGHSTDESVSLSQLHWCSTPSQVFRDQASPQAGSASTNSQLGPADGKPRTITDWNVVKANLNFTIYLPQTLPAGSCLLSVSS